MTHPGFQFPVRVKRIYEPPDPDDGARVLVDRLWPRGMSKTHAALTLWCKEIAPTTELRRWFGHDPSRWGEFRRRYRTELRQNPEPVASIRALCREGAVTLLFAARDERHNEAVLLREFLLQQPITDAPR